MLDRKLAELAELFSTAPEELQWTILRAVEELLGAVRAGQLVFRFAEDPRALIADALVRYAERKIDPGTHPIGKQKR